MYCPYTEETSFKCSIAQGRAATMEKQSTQCKYICLLINKRIMNDFKRVFLVLIDHKKVRSTGIEPNNAFGPFKNYVSSNFFPKCGFALMAKWKTHQRQTAKYIALIKCV